MNRMMTTMLAALAASFMLPVAHAAKEAPATTVEGLQRVADTRLGLVYVRPDSGLGDYRRIQLGEVDVAFRKNWLRDQNRGGVRRVRASDVERIRVELAEMFHEVLFEEFTGAAGYEVTDEPGDDVLLLEPSIVNLDITAPDVQTAGRSYRFAESAGEMTLDLEAFDSVSGELLARVVDRRRDRATGQFEWRSRVANRADAKRVLTSWARLLREGLDSARASAGDG